MICNASQDCRPMLTFSLTFSIYNHLLYIIIVHATTCVHNVLLTIGVVNSINVMEKRLKHIFAIHVLAGSSSQDGSRRNHSTYGNSSRWENHEIMNKWLKKFFTYLDRYYVKHHSLPTLSEAGLRNFRTHIYDAVKTDSTAAILDLDSRRTSRQNY